MPRGDSEMLLRMGNSPSSSKLGTIVFTKRMASANGFPVDVFAPIQSLTDRDKSANSRTGSSPSVSS